LRSGVICIRSSSCCRLNSKMSATILLAVLVTFAMPFQSSAIDNEGLLSKYRNKVVVVMEEGISIGVCAGGQIGESAISPNVSTIVKGLGDIKVRNSIMSKCDIEPLHEGEVLRAYHVSFSFGTLLRRRPMTSEPVRRCGRGGPESGHLPASADARGCRKCWRRSDCPSARAFA
jgi:hypothetical protein